MSTHVVQIIASEGWDSPTMQLYDGDNLIGAAVPAVAGTANPSLYIGTFTNVVAGNYGVGLISGGSIRAYEDIVIEIVASSLLIQLRVIINDLDESDYTYSDERLNRLLSVAAMYVRTDVSADYVVNIETSQIIGVSSDAIDNLIILKAACLLARGESKVSAACSVKITDGPSTMDAGNIYQSNKETAESFCSEYEREKSQYQLNQSQGCSSVTPVKTNCSTKYF